MRPWASDSSTTAGQLKDRQAEGTKRHLKGVEASAALVLLVGGFLLVQGLGFRV